MEPPTVQKNKIECKMTFRNEEPHVNKCFPRIRGDVPGIISKREKTKRFSPHTRGCSGFYQGFQQKLSVFPAYAGMFLAHRISFPNQARFPRIRGDVPASIGKTMHTHRFSPHTRGCSAPQQPHRQENKVFPAYAGMFLLTPSTDANRYGFPRIRGDVPVYHYGIQSPEGFSPHTRGCSGLVRRAADQLIVFPAYAGMFLSAYRHGHSGDSFPRIRGDVPEPTYSSASYQVVFPAYAGMFRVLAANHRSAIGFPRIRGDVPVRQIF